MSSTNLSTTLPSQWIPPFFCISCFVLHLVKSRGQNLVKMPKTTRRSRSWQTCFNPWREIQLWHSVFEQSETGPRRLFKAPRWKTPIPSDWPAFRRPFGETLVFEAHLANVLQTILGSKTWSVGKTKKMSTGVTDVYHKKIRFCLSTTLLKKITFKMIFYQLSQVSSGWKPLWQLL